MFEKIDRHTVLFKTMFQKSGVNVRSALEANQLSVEEYRRAIFDCCHCANVGACERLLGSYNPNAEGIPGFCANSTLITKASEPARPKAS